MTPSQTFLAAMTAMASGDEVAVAAFYSEESRYWDPLSGALAGAAVAPYLASIGRQLDDLTVRLEHVVEDESTACIEWVQHSASAGGRHLLRGATFVTVRGTVLVEQRDYFDYRSSLAS
ncbi:nuclear transport factor 2 family protein [Nocardioides sp. QY071]|uniref:nuclear transport factor 2 family protein n=1 Tax=Nocardioides sp. QY071 TaxID=3044187 RepID=UPI00249BCB58|nr:nuclear transport factor 2 family protein [Nocardioides sp. QY071]WGY02881.1 nuclear transport factor 2 family protein [Nocardioides sp. QY071]